MNEMLDRRFAGDEAVSRDAVVRASAEERPEAGGDAAEHVVEIISDSGEGAQRCGQSLGAIAARMGNGVWTVEIIPAEIRPPARSVAGASGNRVRLGSGRVTNGGDETDLVVAFNEQVLLGRVRDGELKPGCTILLESMWRDALGSEDRRRPTRRPTTSSSPPATRSTKSRWSASAKPIVARPAARQEHVRARHAVQHLQPRPAARARADRLDLRQEGRQRSIKANLALLEAGSAWAEANLDFKFRIPAVRAKEPQIVVNGNTALALGVLASGMEICAMYPITPATSASHYLSDVFEKVGGIVHQAEDEIAACAFAIGASYAGKCAVTITSGPGYSLKQEAIGLAVMAKFPLVVVNVQRGGPSTGQPTKARAGRPAHRDLRQPRRRAQGGDGGEHRSRTASIRSSPRARSPRPSTWSWSSCPTPIWAPRSSRSRGRSSARRGWRRRSTRARCPAGASPTTGMR